MKMHDVMRASGRRRTHTTRRPVRRGGSTAGAVRAITVRDLPAELSVELSRLRRQRGLSFNRLVIELLAERLGLSGRPAAGQRPPDEVDQLAGAWSAEEADALDRAVAEARRVDDELWR